MAQLRHVLDAQACRNGRLRHRRLDQHAGAVGHWRHAGGLQPVDQILVAAGPRQQRVATAALCEKIPCLRQHPGRRNAAIHADNAVTEWPGIGVCPRDQQHAVFLLERAGLLPAGVFAHRLQQIGIRKVMQGLTHVRLLS